MAIFVQKLKKLLGSEPVYVRVWSESLMLRDVATGREIVDQPLAAVSTTEPRRVLAVGGSAQDMAARQRVPFEIVNGFAHPRTLISDFVIAEKTLRHFIVQLLGGVLLKPSPIVVIQPMEKLEGGLTQVEIRAFQELAAGAGARKAYVWVGRTLQDHEVRSGAFKNEEGLLAGHGRRVVR